MNDKKGIAGFLVSLLLRVHQDINQHTKQLRIRFSLRLLVGRYTALAKN